MTAPFFQGAARLFQAGSSSAWLRFLLAAVGLTLAFAAAIFSTASRDAGNVAATVVLASLALVMATAVGLGTVPYLARQLGTKRVRDALDFEVTRAGMLYVLVVLLIGIAALNTGNNLLYIVVGAMLAALLVSGIASALCLRALELDLKIPEHIFAMSEVQATVSVSNPRKWVPSLSISAVPAEKTKVKKKWRWVAASFPVPPWLPPERQWLQLPDRKLRRVNVSEPSGVFHESAYFALLLPRTQLQAEVKLKFRRRGKYQERFSLSTRFPFAFLVKTRRVALSRDVLVWPELIESREVVELLPVLSGKCEAYLRGRGADLYRIREYLPEDSARFVDWKATAKSGSLKVREFSREDDRRLRLVFDNPAPGEIPSAEYERMVSVATSVTKRLADENVFVTFVSQEHESINNVTGFLDYLATVTASKSPSILENLAGSTDFSLVITAQKRGTIAPSLWASSYFLFIE